MATRPPVPPFTEETAIQKVRLIEDAWNSRDPERLALGYSEDSRWRNRAEFLTGRAEIVESLTRKWSRELDYRLIKELWAFGGTGSSSGSPTSVMTTPVTGSVRSATRTGSSVTMA